MPDTVQVGTALLNYVVNNRAAINAVNANTRALRQLRQAQRAVERLTLRVTNQRQTLNQIRAIQRALEAQARASQRLAASQNVVARNVSRQRITPTNVGEDRLRRQIVRDSERAARDELRRLDRVERRRLQLVRVEEQRLRREQRQRDQASRAAEREERRREQASQRAARRQEQEIRRLDRLRRAEVLASRRSVTGLNAGRSALSDIVRQAALASSTFTGIYSFGFGALAESIIEPFRLIDAPFARLQQNIITLRDLSREGLRGGLEGSGRRLENTYSRAGIAVDTATATILRNERRLQTSLGRTQLLLTGVSQAALGYVTATAGVGALFGAGTVFFAAQFEVAFTNVAKTVNTATTSLAELEQRLASLSQTTPGSVNDLSAIATIAGQLGIEGAQNIARFVDTVARLEVSTDLAREDAAFQLARLANRFDTTQYERLASIIVALGNALPTTERRILELSTRFSAAGKIAGLLPDQILAISAAVSSVGIQSELGGTALQRTFLALFDAVARGGDNLRSFANIAGLASEEFGNLFRADPAEAIQAVLSGVRENVPRALQETRNLELAGQRLRLVWLALSEDQDLLTHSLNTAADASRNQTALFDESQRFYNTFIQQLSQVGSNLRNIGIEFGQTLLPILSAVLQGTNEIFLRLQSARELGISRVEALTTSRADLLTRGDRLQSAPLELIRQRQNQLLIEAGEIQLGGLRREVRRLQEGQGQRRELLNAQRRLTRAEERYAEITTELERLSSEISERTSPFSRTPQPPPIVEVDEEALARLERELSQRRLRVRATIEAGTTGFDQTLERLGREFEQTIQLRPDIFEGLTDRLNEAQTQAIRSAEQGASNLLEIIRQRLQEIEQQSPLQQVRSRESLRIFEEESLRDISEDSFQPVLNLIERTRERLSEIERVDARHRAEVLQIQQRREVEVLRRQEIITARNEERVRRFERLRSEFGDALGQLEIEGLPTSEQLSELESVLPRMQRQIELNEFAMRRLLSLGGDFFRELIAGGREGEEVFDRLRRVANRFLQEILDLIIQTALLRPLLERLLQSSNILGQLLGGGQFGVPVDTGSAQHGGLHQGRTFVGEAGPEFVDFRTPARVYSNSQLRELLGAAGSGGSVVVNFSPIIQSTDGPGVRAALQEALPVYEQVIRNNMSRDMRRPSVIRQEFRNA